MLIRLINPDDTGFPIATPRALTIWAVLEGRIGDDRQVLALASALRGAVRLVRLNDTIPEVIAGRALNSIGLHAPWHERRHTDEDFPDLLIAAGGRAVTLARWIKSASDGRTKIVFLGRPWARLADFDLVVTTPQYALPESENVQLNMLPLNHVEADRIRAAAALWGARFAHLPRPWIGAMVGGNSGSFRLTSDCAKQLGARLNRLAQESGGSVLLATSPRTPGACAEMIARSLSCPSHVHLWQASQSENPYLGIIALADRFVVTGESASMIAEAANTGRAIELFDLRERMMSRVVTRWMPDLGFGWLFRLGARSGYWTPPRDMRRLHQALEARGCITGDAQDSTPAPHMRPIEWDLARTVARITQLCTSEPMAHVQSAAQSSALANQAA